MCVNNLIAFCANFAYQRSDGKMDSIGFRFTRLQAAVKQLVGFAELHLNFNMFARTSSLSLAEHDESFN